MSWALDEPAPESWWTVLRARKGEPFEEASRVQAGESLEMSWTDDESRPEQTRYKIRRDCLDTRYRWESAEVVWPPGAAHAPPQRRGPSLKPPTYPIGEDALLELREPASGEIEVALFDVQGRQVLSQRVEPTAQGKIRFSLSATGTSLTSGIYFARVRDALGEWSPAVRTVVLR